MIIFLYGEDGYRIKEKVKEVVEKHKKAHKSGLDLKYAGRLSDNSEKDLADFRSNIKQTSMFKEKKLLIIEDPFSNYLLEREIMDNKDILKKGDDTILIFKKGKVDSKNKLAKFLKGLSGSQEFNLLKGADLRKWSFREVEKNKGKISHSALEKLIERVGCDLWRLSQEINKLTNYKDGKEIIPEDVKFLVRPELETDIFKTIDAIAQKNKKKAINLLHEHLEKGDAPLYLLAMINYQFRNILLVKDFVEKKQPYVLVLKKSGLHPFVARKSFSQSRQFSFEELKKIYRTIFKVDLDIKTGQTVPELALDMFVAGV